MKAKDIMTTDVVTVEPDTTIEQVAEILSRKPFSGLPVVDAAGQVLGIVTEGDLLVQAKRLDLPAYLPFLGGIIYLESPKKLDEQLRKATATHVDEIMTRDVVTLTEEASVEEIASLMSEREVNRIPVVRDGRLVGIVARRDVIRALRG